MRTQQTVLSAAGESDWIPVNHRGRDFGIGFGCGIDSAWSGTTYSIEHSFSDPEKNMAVTISRTTTTATVTFSSAHGLTTSDSVIITGTGDSNLDGHFEVASAASTTTITYTVSDTGASSASGKASPMKVFAHDTVNAQTAAADGGYDLPCRAVRANITTYSAGVLTVDWVFKD